MSRVLCTDVRSPLRPQLEASDQQVRKLAPLPALGAVIRHWTQDVTRRLSDPFPQIAIGDREGRVPELVADDRPEDAFGDEPGGVGVAQLVRHGAARSRPGRRPARGAIRRVFSCLSVTSADSAGALPPVPSMHC
jgi:hypothetical protein